MTSMEEVQKRFKIMFEELSKVIVGQDEVLKQVMISILCNSHALLESYPGLAKTLSIKTISNVMDMKFSRVQGTPDLLPSDVTGTYIIEEHKGDKVFKFQEGPLFGNIVLVDEINRATPKTQAAFLEAMQEKQVTVGDKSYTLPAPFFVLATQNPIEQEGSLDIKEKVLINGKIMSGEDLIKEKGNLISKDKKGIKLYNLNNNAWTFSLNKDGKLEKQNCFLYTLPYQDELIKVTTKSRRDISVTKNHPFLVNNKGIIKWKKAEELTKEDYLVCPAKFPNFKTNKIRSHKETISKMKQKPIKEIPFNKDFAFWIAYILSEGYIGDKVVETTQKNYPASLEKYIKISKDFGFKVGVTTDKTNCRSARIYSKPLVEYLEIRFNIKKKKEKLIPNEFLNWPKPMIKEFLHAFIALEGNLNEKRITFTQKSKDNTNILRYMLLRLGIKTWARETKKNIQRFRIQGEDTKKYLNKIKWIADQDQLENKEEYRSSFRVVPVNKLHITRPIEIFGINSFHTLKNRGDDITKRSWYGSYKGIKEGETVMSETSLKKFIKSMQKELRFRESKVFLNTLSTNPRSFCAKIGLPMTTISQKLIISQNQVWGLYSKGTCQHTEQIQEFIYSEYIQRIQEAKKLIEYLIQLSNDFVCYEKIKSIKYAQSSGLAYGLTVPHNQNYIAGYGGCGINHNTFPLPEAQTDRFLLKIKVDYPSFQEELEIVNKYAEDEKLPALRKVFNKDSVKYLQELTRKMPIARDLKAYAVKVVSTTRTQKDLIEFGASPRASIGLIMAAKAKALIEGRKYVSKKDIDDMAFPVLRHRIILNFEAQRNNLSEDDVIKKLLK